MRIVLATESYLPYLSGVTVSVDALARGLGARGHEVLLLAPRPARGAKVEPVGTPGPAPAVAWLDSYQLPRVAPPAYRMPWPWIWSPAWRQAEAFRPDVVHANSPFVTGLAARRLARRCGAALVFTHHTRFGDYGHYLGPLARPGASLSTAYLRRFWAGCAAIIAPSSDLAGEIRSRLAPEGRERVRVIPTGIDVDGIRRLVPIDPRPAAGWPPATVVLVSLGRLAPEKSPDVVLDAVARVADGHLLVIGGGPSEASLRERAARPDLSGRVAFAGGLPRPEALARLAGGDLFLFASRSETQGLVLAEALAAGLPAVAVDGPGVRDSVRDGVDGVIVASEPASDRPARLAAAIDGLLRDPERRQRLATRARDDARRFALAARVAEIEAVYRSVLP
jgi:1,2-diacylglycerol 3-alpha-glucosyltransferase